MKFAKRPLIIEAIQWIGDWQELIDWARSVSDGHGTFFQYIDDSLHIYTLEGMLRVNKSDWIICGIIGEFYPCRDDIFKRTYEGVDHMELDENGMCRRCFRPAGKGDFLPPRCQFPLGDK